MARARNIKPSFFKNELLGEADPLLGLLFISLWTLADKAGRLEDRPLRIKAETFPYREGIDINGYLTQLLSLGFIDRYKAVCNGREINVIEIVNFTKHQTPHSTEKPSELPEKPILEPITLINESASVNGHINVLNPDSSNTDSSNTESPQLNPESLPPENSGSDPKETELQIACRQTWVSYSKAYVEKYKIEPVRNAKVSSQVKDFVKRIGYEESPNVAAWFLTHTENFYVKGGHVFGMLAKDAEKLRTEWATGNVIEIQQYKSSGQQRIENTNKAVAEFLGEGNQPNVIEGEYHHA